MFIFPDLKPRQMNHQSICSFLSAINCFSVFHFIKKYETHIIVNLLKYTFAEIYQNRWRFDKVIRKIIWCSFYSASALLAMQSAVLARGILSVRPSVRLSLLPSRSGIVSRRMKIRSCGFQHLVGQSL